MPRVVPIEPGPVAAGHCLLSAVTMNTPLEAPREEVFTAIQSVVVSFRHKLRSFY